VSCLCSYRVVQLLQKFEFLQCGTGFTDVCILTMWYSCLQMFQKNMTAVPSRWKTGSSWWWSNFEEGICSLNCKGGSTYGHLEWCSDIITHSFALTTHCKLHTLPPTQFCYKNYEKDLTTQCKLLPSPPTQICYKTYQQTLNTHYKLLSLPPTQFCYKTYEQSLTTHCKLLPLPPTQLYYETCKQALTTQCKLLPFPPTQFCYKTIN
jgi:hypothetical protein